MTAQPTPLRPRLDVEIVPSVYDRVSAAVLVGILVFGFAFVVLLSIWLKPAEVAETKPPKPPLIVSPPPKTDPDEGLVEPGIQEFPEVTVPQLSQLIAATTDAVSATIAVKSRIGDGPNARPGTPIEPRKPEPPIDDTIPTHLRWSVRFQASDIDEYAEQLSFFNIEVAAIHQTRNTIWRVKNVAGEFKAVATNRERESGTLRFQHKKSRMKRWDRELCAKAGIELTGTILTQFYADSTRAILENVEAVAIARDQRQLNEVHNTVFNVVANDDGFAFEVVEIVYR